VTAKPKRERHPHHADLFAIWTEAHRDATRQTYTYSGACAKRLTLLLDERIPRAGDAATALAEVRAAVVAFHRKPLDAFPAGWTVLGFTQDVNRWIQASRSPATPGARNTRGTLASDLFTDDDTPTPRPHAVDAAWSNA